uniref:Uncharacterized protein n=1 Tax=Anguilla anguilla TaxID=7936 RepID=A0A0E9R2J9_ANGAN
MPLFDEGVALDSERDLWVGLGWVGGGLILLFWSLICPSG